jgi:uncharacterized membrane protein
VVPKKTKSVSTAAVLAISSPADAADFTPRVHGFLDTGGTFTQIDLPAHTNANGINDAGQIVGDFRNFFSAVL